MSSPLRQRIEQFCAQPRVQAPSLILSLFGDAIAPHGSRAWLGSIIRLLEPLGLSERLVRTSVFRLAQAGWVASESVGRRSDYALTPSGQRRVDEAARHIYASWAPLWDRRWRLILVVGPIEPKQREQLRQALFWQGFGLLGQDCFVHPSADLSSAFDALLAEGLGDALGQLVPILGADAQLGGSASNADLVARAWNLDNLSRAYEQFVATYMPSLAALRRDRHAELDPEEAFLLRLLLIHDYRRLLLRDPQLPDVLLPADWAGQQARVLCKDLYRRLVGPSERHLAQWLRTADGEVLPIEPAFGRRFPADDPLAAIAA